MSDRPYSLMSCSVSLDGYLGDRTPRLALFNEADFDRVDEVRASCDAILVGAVTVRTDNPRLGGGIVHTLSLADDLVDELHE